MNKLFRHYLAQIIFNKVINILMWLKEVKKKMCVHLIHWYSKIMGFICCAISSHTTTRYEHKYVEVIALLLFWLGGKKENHVQTSTLSSKETFCLKYNRCVCYKTMCFGIAHFIVALNPSRRSFQLSKNVYTVYVGRCNDIWRVWRVFSAPINGPDPL